MKARTQIPQPLLVLSLSLITGCGSGNDSGDSNCTQASLFPALTADPANSAYDDPSVEVSCTDDTVVVISNGIPAYEFVSVTPNGLSSQDWNWEIAREPDLSDTMTDIPLLGTAGFTVNGLPIYGPNEGEFPDPYGDPIYNEIMDFCLGHTGGNADYHYHALLVECILANTDWVEGEPSPVLGYALDGFPIYGPWGCTDESCTEVVEFQSSWETVGDPTTYAWDANECTQSSCDEASGEYLDRCNGRVGPDGAYRYHATSSFPYILGCFHGTASANAGEGQPGGDGGGPGGQAPSDCGASPSDQPCCGDDTWDDPKTAASYRADCN